MTSDEKKADLLVFSDAEARFFSTLWSSRRSIPVIVGELRALGWPDDKIARAVETEINGVIENDGRGGRQSP